MIRLVIGYVFHDYMHNDYNHGGPITNVLSCEYNHEND
jgi:hypothetical protein